MADEKRYLDYDGLSYLVEKLTNRIEAAGGDGKWLPLTGGELTGDLDIGGRLTVDKQTELAGTVIMSNLPSGMPSEPHVVMAEASGEVSSIALEDFRGNLGFLLLTGGTVSGNLTVSNNLSVGGDISANDINVSGTLTPQNLVLSENDGGGKITAESGSSITMSDGSRLTLDYAEVRFLSGTYASDPASAELLSVAGSDGSVVKVTLDALRNALGVSGGTEQGVYFAWVDGDGIPRITSIKAGVRDWPDPSDCVGCLIIEGGRSLLVGMSLGLNCPWAERFDTVQGCFATETEACARADYDGRDNTRTVMEYMDWDTEGSAFGWCTGTMSKGCKGVGAWWLPSLGELAMIARHFDEVNQVWEEINQSDTLLNDYGLWSSTQYDDNNAWFMYPWDGGEAQTDNKGRKEDIACIAVSSWVWVD